MKTKASKKERTIAHYKAHETERKFRALYLKAKRFSEHCRLKVNAPDCIHLFRVGDFYECYREDAKVVSEILGITICLGGTVISEDDRICGFPYHALDSYLPKLIKAGERVTITEMNEK